MRCLPYRIGCRARISALKDYARKRKDAFHSSPYWGLASSPPRLPSRPIALPITPGEPWWTNPPSATSPAAGPRSRSTDAAAATGTAAQGCGNVAPVDRADASGRIRSRSAGLAAPRYAARRLPARRPAPGRIARRPCKHGGPARTRRESGRRDVSPHLPISLSPASDLAAPAASPLPPPKAHASPAAQGILPRHWAWAAITTRMLPARVRRWAR